VLKATQVEDIAYEVLQKYCPQVLRKPCMTPVVEILQGLHKNTGLLVAWEELGVKGDAKVLGKVSFRRKTLFLDVSLDKERKPAFRFTAAHEIGHWVLHRHNWKNLRFDERCAPQEEMDDDESSLCKLDRRSPREWLEFQANVFAASMVMPREPFQEAIVSAQMEMGIKRNLGAVYLSQARYSTRDFQELVSRLTLKFDVSRASVEVRMKTLQLLVDEATKSAKPIKEVLSKALPGRNPN
jgi:Zn-dependent peptidase ImmA (M78 family)